MLDERKHLLAAALLAATPMWSAGCDDGGVIDDDDNDRGTLIITVSPADATVAVEGPNGYAEELEGSETLFGLEPGEYTATAMAEGLGTEMDSVEVEADETARLDFNLRGGRGDGAVGDGGVGADGAVAGMGVLVVSATPTDATIEIQGPDDFSESVEGSETLAGLAPGEYTATASANGYRSEQDSVQVRSDELALLRFDLERTDGDDAPRATYRGADGQLQEIEAEDLASENFVFYAWLRDLPEEGIDASAATPGMPSSAEQTEIAPSATQNLAVAWVGFVDDEGEVWPVSGADVRWRIDRQYPDALNSVHFGAADDGGIPSDFPLTGIDNDQADTRTNNDSVENLPFPLDSAYPLQNRTGIASPDTDGASWVTLFSPDPRARARVAAIASVADVEIGKAVLVKEFAPAADLTVTKSVDVEGDLNLGATGSEAVTFTVTVTNQGNGDATEIVLNDQLASGDQAAYSIDAGSLPEGATGVDSDEANGDTEGFDYTFALAAGESRELTFTANIDGTDTYCNRAQVVSYADEFRTRQPADLAGEACLTAIRPELEVIKDFVDGEGNSLGDQVTVAQGETAMARVRVVNRGGGEATGISIEDVLATVDGEAAGGDNGSYQITSLPEGASANDADGFNWDIGTLAADESAQATFEVSADADGEYCDNATLSSEGGADRDDQACLVVATPQLELTKVNDLDEVLPGETYTSTITVINNGNAPASGVVLADRLGQSGEEDTFVDLVSASVDDQSGVREGNEVMSSDTITLGPGQSVTMEVVTRVPNGAPAGTYCDVGRFESDNAGSDEVEQCVDVPSFAALQTQLIEGEDPLRPSEQAQFTTVLYNEPRSNESLSDHTVTYSFGTDSAADNGTAGAFAQDSHTVYLDDDPERDANTGLVVSGPNSDSAEQLEEGTDYELTTDEPGLQVFSMNDDLQLDSGEAIYIVHDIGVPDDVEADDYSTNYTWLATGMESGTDYDAISAEITTVIE